VRLRYPGAGRKAEAAVPRRGAEDEHLGASGEGARDGVERGGAVDGGGTFEISEYGVSGPSQLEEQGLVSAAESGKRITPQRDVVEAIIDRVGEAPWQAARRRMVGGARSYLRARRGAFFQDVVRGHEAEWHDGWLEVSVPKRLPRST